MTHADFYRRIAQSTAHRPIRDELAAMVFAQPGLFEDLMRVALNPLDAHHHKACWITELVLERKIQWLEAYLEPFCEVLPRLSHDGAVRSMSKIALFAVGHHFKSGDFLSDRQLVKITEVCFDWLIGPAKVASKAYAMRTLLQTGRVHDWVYPELRVILEQGYPHHSAGYQAASRDVLRKIGR